MASGPDKQVIMYADLESGINPLYVQMAQDTAARYGREIQWQDRLARAYVNASGVEKSIGGVLLLSNNVGRSPNDTQKNWWSLPKRGFEDSRGLTINAIMSMSVELDLGINIGLVTETPGARATGSDRHYQVPMGLKEHIRDGFVGTWLNQWFATLPEPPALHLVPSRAADQPQQSRTSTPELRVVEETLVA